VFSASKPDRTGATPLHYCAASDNVEVARALLARGADANAQDDPTGATPLHIAATSGNNAMVHVLCQEGGADVNAPDRNLQETPLFDAAKEGWTDTCEVLLELGADPCRRNAVFYEPYYVAQDWNQWETAEFLIDAMGANYTKVEPFTFPRPPIRTRRKSERGGTGAGDNILAGEGEEEEEEEEEEQGFIDTTQ
jgi:ankyrin repeat protein